MRRKRSWLTKDWLSSEQMHRSSPGEVLGDLEVCFPDWSKTKVKKKKSFYTSTCPHSEKNHEAFCLVCRSTTYKLTCSRIMVMWLCRLGGLLCFLHAGLSRLWKTTIPRLPEAVQKCFKQRHTALARFSSRAPNKQEDTVDSILHGGPVTDEGISSNKNEKFLAAESCWRSCAAAGSGLTWPPCQTFHPRLGLGDLLQLQLFEVLLGCFPEQRQNQRK